MSVFDRVKTAYGVFNELGKTEKRANLNNPAVPIWADDVLLDSISRNLPPMTIRRMLRVPPVFCAVQFLSQTIASLPLKVYRRSGESNARFEDDRSFLWKVLHDAPNPGLTSFRWRKSAMRELLTRGRYVAKIQRDGRGRIRNIWHLPFPRLSIQSIDGREGPELIYVYRGKRKQMTYSQDEVIDLEFHLLEDPAQSIAPYRAFSDAFNLTDVLQSNATRYFDRGGMPFGAIEGPFDSAQAGSRAAIDIGRWLVRANMSSNGLLPLPMGHKVTPLGFNANDSQMVESRRFQVEETSRLYTIPAVFLHDMTKGTFANTEQQDIQLAKHTVTHWAVQWEQELNLKLFHRENVDRWVVMDLDELERGDFRTRVEGQFKQIMSGQRTPREVRDKEHLPQKEGDDKLYIQASSAALENVANETPKRPKKEVPKDGQ